MFSIYSLNYRLIIKNVIGYFNTHSAVTVLNIVIFHIFTYFIYLLIIFNYTFLFYLIEKQLFFYIK